MTVEVRTAPSRAEVGSVVSPAANTARERIAADQILDWVLQGYVFSGGAVLMDGTDTASKTSISDITPNLALVSPSGTGTIVVPLRARCVFTDDGGALSSLDLVFTKSAQECATNLAITGTAVTILNHFTPNPMKQSKCSLLVTAGASAIVAADSCVLAHAEQIHDALTTGLVQLDEVFDYTFETPVALTEGAALLLYAHSGTSAGAVCPTFTWAEIPRDAYAQ